MLGFLRQLVNMSRCERAAEARKSLVGLKSIDVDVTKAVLKELSAEDASLMRLIMSGSIWTRTLLYKAGAAEDPTCKLCGCGEEDLEHLWWKCSKR